MILNFEKEYLLMEKSKYEIKLDEIKKLKKKGTITAILS
jgi:hypothetical protein